MDNRIMQLRSLIDTGATGWSFVDEDIARILCNGLQMEPVRLSKPRPLKGFDGQRAKSVTHAIYPTLTVQNHSESTCPMLITKLGHHDMILGKPWMNAHGVLLDMETDRLIFQPGRCSHPGAPRELASPPVSLPDLRTTPAWKVTPKQAYEMLNARPPTPPSTPPPEEIKSNDFRHPQRSKNSRPLWSSTDTRSNPKSADIAIIGGAAFYRLNTPKHQAAGVKCYSMTLQQIDSCLNAYRIETGEEKAPTFINEAGDTFTKKLSMEEIQKMLPSEFHDLLEAFDPTKAEELPEHRPYDHKIELTGDPSIVRSRVYPLSYLKLQELKKYLEENLKKGFISPSNAPYSSPVLFAVKPNGGLRFCVDYRRLNAITKRNGYPIPLIEETLAKLIGCKYITKLDIIAAFNKLRMDPASEDLTTFTCSMGAYKYHVLPFGLTNGPSNYQHYMNDILFEFLNDFVQCYLDDILIYSKTRKEHTRHVRAVLEKLIAAGLQVDIRKSQFYAQETAFLGVIVSTQGIRMDPKKVEAIVDWIAPTHLKEAQGFIGFCNFYRRFIKGFSKIVRPIVKLTLKDAPFVWSEACQKAFDELKQAVSSAPILRHFDRSREAILETDSSDYVNGGVLSQYDDDGVLHPVAFYSKNLNPAECNYEIYDKELLAIVKCLEAWRPELEATEIPIKIFTDHKALEHFMETKELTRRQVRWALFLSDFNFRIQYQTGARNAKADALTRQPGSTPSSPDDERVQYQKQTILTPDRLESLPVEVNEADEASSEARNSPTGASQQEESHEPNDERFTEPSGVGAAEENEAPIFEKILAANKDDADCSRYRKAIVKGRKTLNGVRLGKCSIKDGALFYCDKLWVPGDVNLQVNLVRESHDPPVCGHPGVSRTVELLRRYYYWPNMKKMVKQYVRNCRTCHRAKAPRDVYNGLLTPSAIPVERWQDIAMDFITGLPEAEGYNAICTFIDKLSKERHYAPCTTQNEGTTAEAAAMILIAYVFRCHGLPRTITSDRGPQFVALVWKSFCRRLGIKATLSTAWHAPTDGQTERANQDVETHLRKYCNYLQDDWPKWLSMAEFADNNRVSESTKMTPFFANKGYHPRMNFGPDNTVYNSTRERLLAQKAEDITDTMENILRVLQSNMGEAQKRMSAQANKHRKPVHYDEGDKVWLSSKNITTARPSKKLDDKMLGPYPIIAKHGTSYKLKLPEGMKVHDVFHPNLLRKDPQDPLPGQISDGPRPVETPEGDEWLVDDILDSRHYGSNNRLQYKVKWHDLDRDPAWYNTDRNEFGSAADVVNDYHARYPDKPGPHNKPERGTRAGRKPRK